MKIETKYNIGQEVWFMYQNRVASAPIRGYQIIAGEGEYFGEFLNGNQITRINYLVRTDDNKIKDIKDEYELFPTKEEFLNRYEKKRSNNQRNNLHSS